MLENIQSNYTLLRKALLANAGFSAATGIVSLVAPDYLNNLFGINYAYVFPALGIALLGFSLLLDIVALSTRLNRPLAMVITISDANWVLGSLLLVFLDPFGITFAGKVVTLLVAAFVAGFGVLQYKGLRAET